MRNEIDKPTIPKIDGFKSFQDLVAMHSGKLNTNETIEDILGSAQIEMEELLHSLRTGDPITIQAEAADVIIFLTHLITLTGGALEDVLSKKIARNYAKYNPYYIDLLTSQGYTVQEARAILKGAWPKEHDQRYIR